MNQDLVIGQFLPFDVPKDLHKFGGAPLDVFYQLDVLS